MSGRISIDNLSDSLKEMIANSGMTEEQIIELLENEEVIDSLKTDSKSIVGAINELFQSANNGKQLIASAIGEPLNAEDTFSAMSNDINGLLSTFKTNMMNNGVTVESSDKFKSLIDKISTIVEEGGGKGIQIANGESTSISYSETADASLIVSNLNFKPNIIIGIYSTWIILYSSDTYFYSYPEYILFAPGTGGHIGSIMYSNINKHTKFYVNNTGFCLPLVPNSYNSYPVTSTNVKWLAIGVGEEDTTLRDSLANILQEEGVSVTEDDDMASLISKVDSEFTKDNGIISGLESDISNGKSIIANAIGIPLTSTDTFTEMGSDINGLLSTFKTNMMNNGVAVESGDKFKTLIDKIATLSDNEGKGILYKTGNLNDLNFEAGTSTSETRTLNVNFEFTPNIVFIEGKTIGNIYGEDNIPVLLGKDVDVIINNQLQAFLTITSYNSTSITFKFSRYTNEFGTGVRNLIYHAIGIGEEDTTLRDSLASILQEEGVSVTEDDDMASLITKVDEEFDRKIDVKNGSYTTKITMTEDIQKITITHNLGKAPSFVSIYIPYTSLYYLYGGYENYLQATTTRAMNYIIDSRAYYDADHRFIVLADSNRYMHAYITDITDTSFSFAMCCGMEGSGYEIHLDSFDWVVM